MVKDDTYENIMRYWHENKNRWDVRTQRHMRVPIMSPAPVSVSYRDLAMPIEPVPMNILTYTYTEENFPDCVVGMVECEGVYVWCGIVEQRP